MKEKMADEVLPTAAEVLEKIEDVSKAALAWLRSRPALGPDAMAIGANDNNVLGNLNRINQANTAAYRRLKDEPVICRVTIRGGQGECIAWYFCKAGQGLPSLKVISYLTPVGRLASMDVGDDYVSPKGELFEVIDKTDIRPDHIDSIWDAESIFEFEQGPPLTVRSLRALLGAPPDLEKTQEVDDAEGILEEILSGGRAVPENVSLGIRRNVIDRMGLREQPILDKFQDEIFRLPLRSRVVLLGPPGTGKTTTLIRRLAQKIDPQYLDDDEKRLVEDVETTEATDHRHSWMMFTPSELLRQYLKEAFAREDVPPSDANLSTWDELRRSLGKLSFPILRDSSGRGAFVLREGARETLDDAARAHLVPWFEDFDAWQQQQFTDELRTAAQVLRDSQEKSSTELGLRLTQALDRSWNRASALGAIANELARLQELTGALKQEIEGRTKAALVEQLRADRDFVATFAAFLEGLKQGEGDDVEEPDPDEDEEAPPPRSKLEAAANSYLQTVRTLSRLTFGKRVFPKSGRAAEILRWLDGRIPQPAELSEIGERMVRQTAARRFTSPVRRYLDGFAARYRAFRRLRQEEGHWYRPAIADSRQHLDPLELDVILLAVLRRGNDMLESPRVRREIDTAFWAPLKAVVDCWRHQILVDEATDFSPIQLSCMGALAHPRIGSVFACGDFNQRLTTWGLRTAEELQWCMSGAELREINVAYRQSRQLNDLARDIVVAMGGTARAVNLPSGVNSDAVSPALLEYACGEQSLKWLAARVVEIERFVGRLPSIAIFVDTEDQVSPTAEALGELLAEQNIAVVACHAGQAVGHESNVRVFDIRHIKGLEFEAVFFLGVDQLAQSQPDLFDRYIYVGVTRAAAYLGLTCGGALPDRLQNVRRHFVQNWEGAFSN